MTLRLCSFCGSAPGDHSGHRASICSDCVRGLASKLGWTMLPPGPMVRSTQEALEGVLAGFPEIELRGISLVHQVLLRLLEPVPPDDLAHLIDEITGLMGGPDAVVVKAAADPSASRAVYWVEGAAGPLFLALPGRASSPVCLAENVPGLQSYGGLLPAEAALRDLTEGACALASGEFDLAERRLARIDPSHSLAPEAALADAVRLALRGDWPLAIEALARVESRTPALVHHLARLNRARLLLLHRRPRPAEDLLDRLTLTEARELRAGLTPEVQLRAECAQGLQHLATALEEFHAATEAWPGKLEELRPRFLTVLPQCGGAAYRYRRTGGGFALQCTSRLHPELPRGWPRWRPGLGVVTRAVEVPDDDIQGARGLSGPLESLAFRRPTRGLWVAACREGAGDLPGAALALRGLPGGEAALYRALLALRLGRAAEAAQEFREVVRQPLALSRPEVLESWLEPAAASARASVSPLSALFLSLVRARRADLVERLLPHVPLLGPAQRLRYLCETAPALLREPGDWPLRQGLEAAFDHRTPEAVLCLEIAVLEEDGTLALLALARQYRLAGRLDAARSVLDEAERLAPGSAPATTLERALIRHAEDAAAGAEALLELAGRMPEDEDLRLELLARLIQAGHPVDRDLLAGGPRAELLRTWIVDEAEAVALCEGLVEKHPRFAAAWLRLATLRQDPEVARQGLQHRNEHVPLLALVSRLCPEDTAARETLHFLRPDLQDPTVVLDRLVLDPPDPLWNLPPRNLAALSR